MREDFVKIGALLLLLGAGLLFVTYPTYTSYLVSYFREKPIETADFVFAETIASIVFPISNFIIASGAIFTISGWILKEEKDLPPSPPEAKT